MPRLFYWVRAEQDSALARLLKEQARIPHPGCKVELSMAGVGVFGRGTWRHPFVLWFSSAHILRSRLHCVLGVSRLDLPTTITLTRRAKRDLYTALRGQAVEGYATLHGYVEIRPKDICLLSFDLRKFESPPPGIQVWHKKSCQPSRHS